MDGLSSLKADRLAQAGGGEFHAPHAGQRRRRRLTEFTRTQLAMAWDRASRELPAQAGISLACTGSVARGEVGPLSDLDLVLLHDGRSHGQAKLSEMADRLWYPLWDSGLGLDHAIRSATQCRQVASNDLTSAVGLLDLHHIAGDPRLVSTVRGAVAADWRRHVRSRLEELFDAVHERHRRVGDLAQLLEPDLKEARGGLRDMTVMRALAASWLTDQPHGRVDAAYAWLLDVRDAIHVHTGRARARLNLPDHDALAALLGCDDADDLLTQVSLAARVISNGLDATMRRARQSFRQRHRLRGPRIPRLHPLGDGIYRHDGEIVLGRGHHLDDPELTLKAALHADAEIPLSPVTVQNLARQAAPLPEPWHASTRALLVQFLGRGTALLPVWEQLDHGEIIDQWLPEWGAIRSRPQRNTIHRHTVDRHSLEAVVWASKLVDQSPRPDLLVVATLLHDIGKVAGVADHSTTGAAIAARVARRWGFPESDVTDITTLVREHLTLARLATVEDPDDPVIQRALLDAVDGRVDLLTQLRLLTEADARAAGPKVWSPWRARLVTTLCDRIA